MIVIDITLLYMFQCLQPLHRGKKLVQQSLGNT